MIISLIFHWASLRPIVRLCAYVFWLKPREGMDSGATSSRQNNPSAQNWPETSAPFSHSSLINRILFRLQEKQTNRKEWTHWNCMAVWTKTGPCLLPKTNSQNTARWVFHCRATLMKGSWVVLPRDCIVIHRATPPPPAWSRETSKSLALCPTFPPQMVIPVWVTWKTTIPPWVYYIKECLIMSTDP